MKVGVQFQRFGTSRPQDYAMNNEPMEFSDTSLLPNKGDYITFSEGKIGEEGFYKVRSRLFSYSQNALFINIVVEDIESSKILELLKE